MPSNPKWTGPVGRLWSPREIEADGGPKHTKLYLLLAAKELEAVKLGSKTKITGRSYDAYKAALPAYTPHAARAAIIEHWGKSNDQTTKDDHRPYEPVFYTLETGISGRNAAV